MKRMILSLLGSLMIIGGSFAASREKSEIKRIKVPAKQEQIGEITVNGRTFKVMTPPGYESPKHATRAEASTPVIKEAPGTLSYYCKDVIGYGLGMPIQGYSVASQINWDGDDAYFYDIITAAPMGSYVKGTKQGNEIVLKMGQTVLEFDDEEYDLNFGLLRPVFMEDAGSTYVWFEYSDDYDTMSYSVSAQGSLELQSPDAKYIPEGMPASYYGFPDYVIGYYYTDDYLWASYCDVFQIYDEFNFEKVEVPEGLPVTTLTYINQYEMGVIVEVAEDTSNNALYIKGLSAYAPDAVFKADIVNNGEKLSVSPNQFIGIEADLYYIVTSTVYRTSEGELEQNNNNPAYFNLERDSDGKIQSITADPDSNFFLAFNDDPFYFWEFDSFENLELTLQETFEGIPGTPYDAYYEDYSELMGANFVFFRLSSFSYNGDIIDINNLYYSVFINGEPVEFEQTDGIDLNGDDVVMYNGIKEPTYLIPYTFANDVDLYEDTGGTFIVGLYAEGIDNVGVQGVYVYNDTETRGGLVTIDTATGEQSITPGTDTKVEYINVADVVSAEYYDLQGRKVAAPAHGLFVKKYKLKDGSTKAVKVMVR